MSTETNGASSAATATQRFSYKKALSHMNEKEIQRFCCVLLTCYDPKPSGEEFKLAALQFDSAPGGFAKMVQTTLKKLRENECYIIEGEDVASIPVPEPGAVKTPATKKRKTPAAKDKATDGSAENDDGEEPSTPAKKPRGRPKKTPAKVKDEDMEADEKEVKTEAKDSKEDSAKPEAGGEEMEV